MGLDPEYPDYEEGDECPLCVDLLFDGLTPKYVEADVSGIVACPLIPMSPPVGTFLLTQTYDPCKWEYMTPEFVITWGLEPDRSYLTIWVAGGKWFYSEVLDQCFDAFVNELDCSVGLTLGENGYVTLWWGPTIGPGP